MFAGPNNRRTRFERRSGGDRRKEDRRESDFPALDLQGRGQRKGSRGTSNKVVPGKKDLAEAWNHKGKDFVELKEYEEAKKAFHKAVEIKPQLAEAWYNLADLYVFQGEKEEALSKLQRALDIDPSYKEKAKLSNNFKRLKRDEDFQKLVG
ncbi:MAG: tetratricopeptide repeat protein [Desulfobacterales bacterium]|nr:tetratricopeptide repeat protein [Desulfobacterales bacterium]